MNRFKIPVEFSPDDSFSEKDGMNIVERDDDMDKNVKESIGNFIKLLVNSPNGSFKPDARFGFSLKNCHFENANSKDEIKGKKINGRSNNANNYAKDLEKTIELFEPRLQNINIKTEFEKIQSRITIIITGTTTETKKEYKQELEFYIWQNDDNVRRV